MEWRKQVISSISKLTRVCNLYTPIKTVICECYSGSNWLRRLIRVAPTGPPVLTRDIVDVACELLELCRLGISHLALPLLFLSWSLEEPNPVSNSCILKVNVGIRCDHMRQERRVSESSGDNKQTHGESERASTTTRPERHRLIYKRLLCSAVDRCGIIYCVRGGEIIL